MKVNADASSSDSPGPCIAGGASRAGLLRAGRKCLQWACSGALLLAFLPCLYFIGVMLTISVLAVSPDTPGACRMHVSLACSRAAVSRHALQKRVRELHASGELAAMWGQLHRQDLVMSRVRSHASVC